MDIDAENDYTANFERYITNAKETPCNDTERFCRGTRL